MSKFISGAVFNGVIRSEYLGMKTGINVIIPDVFNNETKILYLYHGLSDNCSAWGDNTSVTRYANIYNYMVVMPEVQKSWYTNYKEDKYFNYVSEELPQIISSIFNVDNSPAKTYVAGLSMGGYGATKVYLNNPERYSGFASFSGALFDYFGNNFNDTIKYFLKENPSCTTSFDNADKNTDCIYTLAKNIDKNKLSKIYFTCGTNDFLFEDNNNFVDLLNELGVKNTYETWHGEHEWGFWDLSLKKAMEFFNK